MKISFNEATTLKNSNLDLDLKLCEKYGYDFIEIRLDKLKEYLATNNLKDLSSFFSHSRLKPFALNALECVTFRKECDYKNIKKDLEFLCQVSEEINCRKIVVVPSFDIGGYTRKQIKEETVKILNDLADTAEKYGIDLAFEFVGYPNCSVNTFDQAYDIVKSLDRDSIGIVLDCFHFYAMKSKIEDLKKADANKIFILHIDDAEDLPPGALRDENRLWPGDGVIDLGLILKTLKEIGYDSMMSVELFRPEYWRWDAEQVIKTAKEKAEALFKKYF